MIDESNEQMTYIPHEATDGVINRSQLSHLTHLDPVPNNPIQDRQLNVDRWRGITNQMRQSDDYSGEFLLQVTKGPVDDVEPEHLPSAEEVVRDLDTRLQNLQNADEAKQGNVDEARIRLRQPIDEAIEDSIQPPEPVVLDKAAELLALVSPECYEHDVENHVTQDGDVVTDIVDSEDNYVMMKSRADGTVAIHFNICGFDEYEVGEPLDEAFIVKLIRCLSKDNATA